MHSQENKMYVDLKFALHGKEIPADHGFKLFSAISKLIPELHDDPSIAIAPIKGVLLGNRKLGLTRNSTLTLRTPALKIKDVLLLAGKTLKIGPDKIRVGIPQPHTLQPCSQLHSRLVIIKGFMEPEPFLEAVQRQLTAKAIKGTPKLIEQHHIPKQNGTHGKGSRSPYLRRTLEIHRKQIVGFALRISDLSEEDSLKLQIEGIGGRRRFGCGVFFQAKVQDS